MSDVFFPEAAVIIIGNEILSGQTEDVNLNYLARRLHELGILLKEALIIPDIEEDIIQAVNRCRARRHYVFTTGGIGPTHDDITTLAISKAFGKPLACNLEAATRLSGQVTGNAGLHSRMKMTEMPVDAALIDNPVSMAPGFQLENVFVFAGIPRIMQTMFEAVVPRLQKGPARYVSVVFDRVGENLIAHELFHIQKDYPDVEIGSYPRWIQSGNHGVRIVVRGLSQETVTEVQEKILEMFANHGGSPRILDEQVCTS